ncbi:Kazal-type serine protease inhibitor domain protein [Minicystis rosea]|nr:Kazal-type serine protease inhibitor domain protein [Minicystis rosea]
MRRSQLLHAGVAAGILVVLAACARVPDGGEAVADGRAEIRGAEQGCGGTAGLTCSEGFTCIYPIGSCGAGDAVGKCSERSEICPFIWSPVCGCDAHTYPNGCEAGRAGVSIAHRGACDEDPHELSGEPAEAGSPAH